MARLLPSLLLASALGLATGVALARASRHSAESILAELRATPMPSGILDDEGVRRLEQACRRRTQLELELYESWPRHARVPGAMRERWALLENTFHEHATVLEETRSVLARTQRGALARAALEARAWSCVHDVTLPVAECLTRIDASRTGGHDSSATAAALLELVLFRCSDPGQQSQLLARVAEAASVPEIQREDARKLQRLAQRAGLPLALEFEDVLRGGPATLEPWRGHPLIVYVRENSAWQPLPEGELDALEARHRELGLVVLELVIGDPGAPAQRVGRRIVAPGESWPEGWSTRFGLPATVAFLAVDREGRLSGWSRALAPVEERVEALR